MRRIWLTTDTHFQHRKLIDRGFRPPDFEARIIRNWKRMVQPGDHVIHLGDVIVGHEWMLPHILESLPGTKTLIRGNHDQKSCEWYRRNGFLEAVDALRLGQVYMTHEPQSVLPDGCVVNVHGHLHDDNHHRHEYVEQPWQKLLAIELTRYEPVRLDHFIRPDMHP